MLELLFEPSQVLAQRHQEVGKLGTRSDRSDGQTGVLCGGKATKRIKAQRLPGTPFLSPKSLLN